MLTLSHILSLKWSTIIDKPPITANVPLFIALRALTIVIRNSVLFNSLRFLNLFLLLLVYVNIVLNEIQLLIRISLFAQDIRNTRFVVRIKLMKIIRCIGSTRSENFVFVPRPRIFPSPINLCYGWFILSDVGRRYCEVLRFWHLGVNWVVQRQPIFFNYHERVFRNVYILFFWLLSGWEISCLILDRQLLAQLLNLIFVWIVG